MKSESVRLNKYIADCGLCSRRAADRLIEEGSVSVNGRKVYELGVQVDPKVDKVLVKGKPLRSKQKNVYFAFHKPKGVLTSMSDPEGRPTVADFFKKIPFRLFPVGRLDWDSEGLLLFTNDGDFAQEITNPKSKITKTYMVKLSSSPSPEQIEKLKAGVSIPGGRVSALRIEKIPSSKSKYPWYKIVITEGKNRQIRQMFAKINADVTKLQRVGIGSFKLGTLQRGEIKPLTNSDMLRVLTPDVRKPKVQQANKVSIKKRVQTGPKSPAIKKKKAAKAAPKSRR